MKKKRGAFEMDMMAWWIWGVIGLIIILGVIFVLKGKGTSALTYLKNTFGIGK